MHSYIILNHSIVKDRIGTSLTIHSCSCGIGGALICILI